MLKSLFNKNDELTQLQLAFPKIDAIYHEYAKENHFPGYAYGIIFDGKLIHIGSDGFMDRNKKNSVTSHSMFRIASMTKSFVAMSILKLRDEGKLRLDDSVQQYLPEMQKNSAAFDDSIITIRDLLIHTSGLPFDDPWADRLLDITGEAFQALLHKGFSFSSPTGIAYEYSSLGYALLGEVIKRVSGISYQKYIIDNICSPIGMTRVYWNYNDIPASKLACGYHWMGQDWREEPLLPDGAFGSMGGMITSIESFSRYIALHQFAWPPRNEIETGPLKRSSIREMHQPWRFVDLVHKNLDEGISVQANAYGYGLRWIRDLQGKIFVGHSGGLPGFGSNWLIMPEYGLGVVLFANVTYAPATQINLIVLDKMVTAAQLSSRKAQPSKMLEEKQKALLKLLPYWENATTTPIFAKNFFLDHCLESLKKESIELFAKAGKVISISEMKPESQLKGSFVLNCEAMNLCITFSLNPEVPPLIQQFHIISEKN